MILETGEEELILSSFKDETEIRAITWEIVKKETLEDESMRTLYSLVNSSFPDDKHDLPPNLIPYWNVRNNLYVLDGVVLMRDQVVIPPGLRDNVSKAVTSGLGARIIIPPNLRQEVVKTLHSAHQGVGGMNERAKAAVYWPGITKDIETVATNQCHPMHGLPQLNQ